MTTCLKQLTGLATGTVTLGEVTTLNHEVLDDAVEGRALVTEALLTGSKGTEVLSGLGNGLAVESHNDAAELLLAMLNVKVDLVGDLWAFCGLCGLGKEQGAQAEEQGGGEDEAPEIEHGLGSIVAMPWGWTARIW